MCVREKGKWRDTQNVCQWSQRQYNKKALNTNQEIDGQFNTK